MHPISHKEFTALIEGARLIQGSPAEPKVYETPDGRIVKLLRVKRWLSSNLLCPYALRFARNAARLAEVGVPSLHVEQVAKVIPSQRQMVVYARLPGTALRHALRNAEPPDASHLMRSAGEFVANIHHRGVYFRSMHFGNVLVGDDGVFALIDILDLKVFGRPLGMAMRKRNFKHMIRYDEDRRNLRDHWTAFREGYRMQALKNGGPGMMGMDDLLDDWKRQLD
jgi:tRNA A-37 threonylcarbamoyl transferase component Bud32